MTIVTSSRASFPANYDSNDRSQSSLFHQRKKLAISQLLNTSDATLIDFLIGFFEYDPKARLSPLNALYHPFIGKLVPFGRIFQPSQQQKRREVMMPSTGDVNGYGGSKGIEINIKLTVDPNDVSYQNNPMNTLPPPFPAPSPSPLPSQYALTQPIEQKLNQQPQPHVVHANQHYPNVHPMEGHGVYNQHHPHIPPHAATPPATVAWEAPQNTAQFQYVATSPPPILVPATKPPISHVISWPTPSNFKEGKRPSPSTSNTTTAITTASTTTPAPTAALPLSSKLDELLAKATKKQPVVTIMNEQQLTNTLAPKPSAVLQKFSSLSQTVTNSPSPKVKPLLDAEVQPPLKRSKPQLDQSPTKSKQETSVYSPPSSPTASPKQTDTPSPIPKKLVKRQPSPSKQKRVNTNNKKPPQKTKPELESTPPKLKTKPKLTQQKLDSAATSAKPKPKPKRITMPEDSDDDDASDIEYKPSLDGGSDDDDEVVLLQL